MAGATLDDVKEAEQKQASIYSSMQQAAHSILKEQVRISCHFFVSENRG